MRNRLVWLDRLAMHALQPLCTYCIISRHVLLWTGLVLILQLMYIIILPVIPDHVHHVYMYHN